MNFSHPDFIYWLASAHLPGVGSISFRKALNYFGHIKNIFSASSADLQRVGFKEKQIDAFKQLDWKAVERSQKWCETNQCSFLIYQDNEFPRMLKEVESSAPIFLFVLGEVSILSKQQLAMVGSRNPTPTGKKLAEDFASCLAEAGLIITSGLALGVDTASHRGALLNGKTIAVSGCGLDTVYPAANRALAEDILKKEGAIVSEFPPFTPVKTKHFPMRNRIISGLSLGVLVVEAALRSGSLITARFAVEQNREVFAIPGSIHNPLARGCHQLIRQGAKLVETAKDVLEELKCFQGLIKQDPVLSTKVSLDIDHKRLLKQIGYEVTSLDVILARSRLTAGQVSSMLLSLELMGLIKTVPGGYAACLKS